MGGRPPTPLVRNGDAWVDSALDLLARIDRQYADLLRESRAAIRRARELRAQVQRARRQRAA